MARFPRLVAPGTPLHLIQRGNNRSPTFRTAEDFRRYHTLLLEASKRYECAVHAYVLMTNHVHLLLTPADAIGPARMMQAVGRTYVRYFNARHNRTGTLWEGRYRSTLVDSERYLLACSRYIELNPVRARMVEHPGEYHWSSYAHNADGALDTIIAAHPVYQALNSAPSIRQREYRSLFKSRIEPNVLDAIRRCTNRGTALGDSPFCEQVEEVLKRPVTRMPHGGDRRSKATRSSPRGNGQAEAVT